MEREAQLLLQPERRATAVRLDFTRHQRRDSTWASSIESTPSAAPRRSRSGEDTLTSYEVGLKSTWGDGRTRFNAAAFYYDYEDFQTFRFELLNQVIFNTMPTR